MGSIDNVCYFGYLLAILLRWLVSRNGYSGAGQPPMFGDYEAQRHWMEITVNLPIKEWYTNSSSNDLLYWGLDYPPLTAHHSYINGKIARYLNESWVALNTSRGMESYHHKLFMRSSVIISDILIYFSGVTLYWLTISHPHKPRDKAIAAVLTLIYPGLILIDHGHFQYNCISLGLTIWTIVFFIREQDLLGSIAFILALNYKQMTLYYALPIFFYLLGRCWRSTSNMKMLLKFFSLAITVIITFAICWWPYIQSIDSTLQVLSRLFPFNRGIYEDKVANFWCAISVLIKLKNLFSRESLVLLSGLSTLIAMIPSSIHLFNNPSIKTLRYALVNSSLIFFLFSFQVHEKTILFAAIPFLLLLEEHPLETVWFIVISTFSLQSLVIKDALDLPYYALLVFFLCAFLNVYGDLKLFSPVNWKARIINSMFLLSMLGCLLLSIAASFIPPTQRLPDIHAVLNAIYSCLHFVIFTLMLHHMQLGNTLEVSHQYKLTLKEVSFKKPTKLTKIKKNKQS